MRSLRKVGAAVALMTALGCTEKSAPEPSAPATPATPVTKVEASPADAAPQEEVKTHMVNHFARALAIKDAVIKGDLAATREPAKWLAEHGAPPSSPDEWVPFITELRQVAAGADEAKDITAVADALSRVAVVCGRCHTENKIRVETKSAPKPGDDQQMLLHAWASDQMWEGLVIPDSARWSAGAETLASAATLFGKEHAKAGAQLAGLAKSAKDAPDDLSKAATFGKIMATCAGCHGAR